MPEIQACLYWMAFGNVLVKCAQAGALATETRMEMELIDSNYNVLPNDALAELVDRNLRRVGGVTLYEEEQDFAERLRKTLPLDRARPLQSGKDPGAAPKVISRLRAMWGRELDCPTAALAPGHVCSRRPGHSWQSTALRWNEHRKKGHAKWRQRLWR